MKRCPLTILAVVYALVVATQAQSTQTTQAREDVVRTSYAKLIFANQVGLIETYFSWQKLQHPGAVLSQVLKDHELTFELSNFKEGDVPCSQVPMSELQTYMGGKPILDVGGASYTFDNMGKEKFDENTVTIREGVGQVIEAADREDAGKFVICDLNTLANPGTPHWSKYVSYDVVATYKGNGTKYRATFVFDYDGNTAAYDPYVGGIGSVVKPSVYPEVLLNTSMLQENHDVMEWAKANSSTGTPSKQMFCDLKTLKCLIPAADIVDKSKPQQAGLGSPLPPN